MSLLVFPLSYLQSNVIHTKLQNNSTRDPHSCHTCQEPKWVTYTKGWNNHPTKTSPDLCQECVQILWLQMSRTQKKKHTHLSNQDNMSATESKKPTVIGPVKNNLAKAQKKDFRIVIMNTFKDLNEEINILIAIVK